MSEMQIHIGVCGSHSITGAVQELVNSKGLSPKVITINIDRVMHGTTAEQELAEAQRLFQSREYEIKLGHVKEQL